MKIVKTMAIVLLLSTRALLAMEQLQEQYDKKMAEYDTQIARVEAEQSKLGDMAQYDGSLQKILGRLKTQRDETTTAFEWNKKILGKSPAEIQRMTLERERLQHLEEIKRLDKVTIDSDSVGMLGLATICKERESHIQKLGVINATLLGINVEPCKKPSSGCLAGFKSLWGQKAVIPSK
jgi:hypothetical protein